MAVSGKTSVFKIPYFLDSDKPPNMATVTEAQAKALEALLENIDVFQLRDATPNRIIVCNPSGVPTWTAMSGDIAINSSGGTAIGAKKVLESMLADAVVAKLGDERTPLALSATEGKIADKAVTSRKAKLTGGVVRATGALVLTNAYQDVPGMELKITPAVASLLRVTIIANLKVLGSAGSGQVAAATLKVDSESEFSQIAEVACGVGASEESRGTVAQVYEIPLASEAHTIKMRAKKTTEEPAAECVKSNTAMLYELVAS